MFARLKKQNQYRFLFIASLMAWSFPFVASAIRFDEFVSRYAGPGIQAFFGLWIGIAVFYIGYWISRYVIKGPDPSGNSEALTKVMWGFISVFIIFSLWGILNLLLYNIFPTNNVNNFNLSNRLWSM